MECVKDTALLDEEVIDKNLRMFLRRQQNRKKQRDNPSAHDLHAETQLNIVKRATKLREETQQKLCVRERSKNCVRKRSKNCMRKCSKNCMRKLKYTARRNAAKQRAETQLYYEKKNCMREHSKIAYGNATIYTAIRNTTKLRACSMLTAHGSSQFLIK